MTLALSATAPAGTAVARHERAIGAKAIAKGLNFPAAFTFAPDGRIFYGERLTGQIRIYDPKDRSNTLFYKVGRLRADHDRGLLGLALDPGYPKVPYLYAYVTRRTYHDGLRNQILRIVDVHGSGAKPRAIWMSNTPSGGIHNGGRILFGPDGKLYAFEGAPHEYMAQDLTMEAGKVLRMNSDGTIPSDNPFPGTRIWSYGNRNSYGFAFDPMTGRLWQTENGPECNDEINLIVGGSNYGWGPTESCDTPPALPLNTNQDGPDPVAPIEFFPHPLAVTGIAFCSECRIAHSEGDMFWGDFKNGNIHRDILTADRTDVVSTQVVYTNMGRILSMERGPDGALYFSDLRDGVGGIYRLVNT